MATQLLSDKYADALDGMLSCFDRIIVIGSLDPVCYAHGMTKYLYAHHIRIFDYAQFAKPLAEAIRRTAEGIAQAHQLTIEFVRTKKLRKEDRIQAILKARGEQPGLVHIFSAMESCGSYAPWHDKTTGHTFLKYTEAKCLHYYFYFIDEELGVCYLRVPTWCPFRLQFYCNGHAWLASQLTRHGIDYVLRDNAFVHIADYTRANELAAHLDIEQLHAKLDRFAAQYCPVIQTLNATCHWSLMQVEYATDLVFKHRCTLQAFYPLLLERLIHAVKPEDIAMFLGHKLSGNYQGEVGSRFNVRVPGTRIKHAMKSAALKLYDKFGLILRIETTVTDVSFFQQYREVQHRNGQRETKWAKMKKTIYSLRPLGETLAAANRRYLEFLSDIETPEMGVERLQQLTTSKTVTGHRYKGFNFFADGETHLFRLLLRGEFAISGLTSRALRALMPDLTTGQVSRLLKRLRVYGLLKKVTHRYKYYLTDLGRYVATLVLKLRELYIIPSLARV